MQTLRVGILGFGTVGRGVARMLRDQADILQQRAGVALQLTAIATRTPGRDRGIPLDGVTLTDDAARVTAGDDVDVVCELIGGLDPAESLVRDALGNGKHVVTANKALIAERGNGLIELAAANNCELLFEASTAGAIPIIKALRESLAGNRINRIQGILNGTCNYILTEMREKGLPYEQVLAEAQRLGYAEADPTFDVGGFDAAHKLTILAAIGFGIPLSYDKIQVEGIAEISDVDIAWATEMGYRIKLLGIANRVDGEVELRVQPTLVAANSMLGAVEGVFNAVRVEGDFSGPTLYYGRGAGEEPTASAVVADLVDIARNIKSGGAAGRTPLLGAPLADLSAPVFRSPGEHFGAYYLRLSVIDKPGVLADITALLKKHDISIDALVQRGRSPNEAVPLVMVTHEAREAQMLACLAEIEQLPLVESKAHMIRIEEDAA
ncbi:homoserine dehydrogenase [Magnetofaba australis]|nr:homoserine dehydrogenase [Magnetofaba australis]